MQVAAPTGKRKSETVESIDLGYTTLRTADGRRLVIPNATIASQTSINLSLSHPAAPCGVALTVTEGGDIARARQILLDVATKVPKITKVDGCFVTGVSSQGTVLTLIATCADPGDATQIKSDLLENAKKQFDAAGVRRIRIVANDPTSYSIQSLVSVENVASGFGTKKGLFLFTSTGSPSMGVHRSCFNRGEEVNHAVFDPRSGRIFATANDSCLGCEVVSSGDMGITWVSAKQNPKYPENSGMKLDRIWHVEPGRASEPGVLYAGIAPAALFRVEDNGEIWNEVTTLTAHSTRPHWHPVRWATFMFAFHRHRPLQPEADGVVGISAVGVFRTEDGGATWETANRGTRAEFLPDKLPEYGQCVHKVLMTKGDAPLLYQQNHCGVYRSADGGRAWREITKGLPSDFGFPLALHPRQPQTLYVLPLQGAEFRAPPERKLRVFRSRDAGETWTALGRGLPEANFFGGIYREGMAADSLDPSGIYFGTYNGKIFSSADEGDSWQLLIDNLPPVYSISVAAID